MFSRHLPSLQRLKSGFTWEGGGEGYEGDEGYEGYGPGLGNGLELWTRVMEAMDQGMEAMDQG